MRSRSPHRHACALVARREAAPLARTRARIATLAVVAGCSAVAFSATSAAAQCVLVRERDPRYAPHVAMHFGDASDVPLHIQCAAVLDKGLPALCVPLYAYNLWEGATAFEFALRSPRAPIGFDRGPDISQVAMDFATDAAGTTTSLRIVPNGPLCGPVFLGCLHLATADLPDAFQITMASHRISGRAAAETPDGEWRSVVVDDGGARVGSGVACPPDGCPQNTSVRDLAARTGEISGVIDLSWTSGSGSFTLLRYRTDGKSPVDPWDGQFLALLPSSIARYSHLFNEPGELQVTAWSITRGPFGNLYAASSIECGSLASTIVHLPVGVTATNWGKIKSLYR